MSSAGPPEGSAWLPVGRLLRTRGRVGELIAEIDSNQPGRAERLTRVLLRTPSAEASFQIARLWYHQDRPIFQFEGIDSISAAEPWEGAEILVPPEERVAAEEGEYLYDDLIGCVIEDRGRDVGAITAIEETGGPLLLRVDELLIPFAKAYIVEIDIAAKRIRMDLPEGLTDL